MSLARIPLGQYGGDAVIEYRFALFHSFCQEKNTEGMAPAIAGETPKGKLKRGDTMKPGDVRAPWC